MGDLNQFDISFYQFKSQLFLITFCNLHIPSIISWYHGTVVLYQPVHTVPSDICDCMMTSWEGSAPVGPVTEGDMGDIWSPEGGNLSIYEGYHGIIAYRRLFITWKVIYTEILSPRLRMNTSIYLPHLSIHSWVFQRKFWPAIPTHFPKDRYLPE